MNTIVNPAPRPEGQGLFLRCWVKTGLILGWAVLGLMGCSSDLEGQMDGHYVTNHLTLLGMASSKKQLIIEGENAMMIEPPSMASVFGGGGRPGIRETMYHVKYADNRILIYSRTPMDGMVFHVTNEGNTLKCLLCESVKKPVIWERFDAWDEDEASEDAQDEE